MDAYGSDTLRRDYFAPLIAAGGELRWFNPQRFLRRSFRNHRKLLRADGEAVIRGLNIADAYDGDGLEAGWRDFAARVDGPVVDPLAASFARMWDLSAFGRRQFRRFWRTAPQRAAGAGEQPELLLPGPGCPTAELRRRLLFDIRAASRMQAWAAYFLPSRRIGAAIRDAARRGEADIMLGERSDVPVSRWASERLFTRFENPIRLSQLLADGEVDFAISYHPAEASKMIHDGLYPATVRTFVFEEGTIANTHFVAIPFNASDKEGAMVEANFLISPEAQLKKADPTVWGDFPAIDLGRLDKDWQEKFAALPRGCDTAQ